MPHRLLILALVLLPVFAADSALAQPAPGGQPSVVTIQLSEHRIEPKQIALEHGQAYVLRISNAGQRQHGFSAKSFLAAASVSPSLWLRGCVVDPPPGQSVDVALTAPPAGEYDFDCPHAFHQMPGMKGANVVR